MEQPERSGGAIEVFLHPCFNIRKAGGEDVVSYAGFVFGRRLSYFVFDWS